VSNIALLIPFQLQIQSEDIVLDLLSIPSQDTLHDRVRLSKLFENFNLVGSSVTIITLERIDCAT
jgi:hypothetical protein